MFTTVHFIWLGICALVLAAGVYGLKKYKPSLKTVLNIACIVCVISELIKMFSMIRMVPSSDGGTFYPYIEMQHLPLHLCSLQIILIFYVRFAKESALRTAICGFIYPTAIAGAFFAVMMPSIFNGTIERSAAFVHPLAYQFFLYHTMLILLGICIPMSGEIKLCRKHYGTTLGILLGVALVSLYLNSMFAQPIYANGALVSLEYVPNFFFTYEAPIPIALTQLWHWYVYLGVLLVLAVLLVTLFYLPWLKKKE